MKKVGVFRYEYPHLSEGFIARQFDYMHDWKPHYLCFSEVASFDAEKTVIADQLPHWHQRVAYAVTGNPSKIALPKDISLVHSHFGPDALYGVKLAKKLDVPSVVTFHGYDVTQKISALIKMRRPIFVNYVFNYLSLNDDASLLIAVSDFIKRKMIDRGYDKDKILRHYLGVDVDGMVPRQYGRLSGVGRRYILTVGRHVEVKGFDVLLRAFSEIAGKYSDVDLMMIGSGKLTNELKDQANALGVGSRVLFVGSLSHSKVMEHMQSAEFFVMASRKAASGAEEALGLVFNEAAACGLPIIGTHHGGIPETLIEGETGLLVPENDPPALAQAMAVLLDDRALNEAFGVRGREFVSDQFNLKTQGRKLEEIYSDLTR